MIGLAIDGGLWTVTINRPEKANSLTAAMLEELDAIAVRAAAQGARVLVLTGVGRVFPPGPIWTRRAPGWPRMACGNGFQRGSPGCLA